MSAPPSALRRRCVTYSVTYFAALWITKPFTTGFTEWVPTLLAHVVMAGIVIVLCLGMWLADHSLSPRSGPTYSGPVASPTDSSRPQLRCPTNTRRTRRLRPDVR